MNTSRKTIEWFIYFSIRNLTLGCPLFKKFKKFNESCSLSKADRYDILATFDNEQDSLNFLNLLNNRHPNIKFTIEKQINNSIAFLEVSFQVSIIKISHFEHITNELSPT